MAWDEVPLFPEDFEAWASGPVCPPLYERHKGIFRLYSNFLDDIPDYEFTESEKETMDIVLDSYGEKSPEWLTELTHMEPPWKTARGNTPLGEPCRNIIAKESMMVYYGRFVQEKEEE